MCAEKSSCSKACLASAEAGSPSTLFSFPRQVFPPLHLAIIQSSRSGAGVIAEFSDWLPVLLKLSTMKLLQTQPRKSLFPHRQQCQKVPKAPKCESVKVSKCQSAKVPNSLSPRFTRLFSLQKGLNFKYLLFDKANSRPAADQRQRQVPLTLPNCMSFAYFPPIPDAKALLWVHLLSLYLHPHRESGQTTGLCGNAPKSQLLL